MNKKILKLEFYNISISNRFATVSKEFYNDANTYTIRFINNEESDFINSYKSLGFIVEENKNQTSFKVFGTLTTLQAGNIWLQIKNSDSPLTSSEIILK